MKKKTDKKSLEESKSTKKIMDSYFLNKEAINMETEYYTFGTYSDYNGLDVKNMKHPFFDKK